MVKQVIKSTCLLILVLLMLQISVYAEEVDYAAEYKDMLDSLPDYIVEILPEKLFSDDIEEIGEGAEEVISLDSVLRVIVDQIGLKLEGVLKMLALILGTLIISSMLGSVKSAFSSGSIVKAFSLLSACVVFLSAVGSQMSILQSVSEFFDRLCLFVNTLIPLTCSLYAMGGNVATAVVNHSSLMIFMNIVENFCAQSVMVICGICLAFAAVNTVLGEIDLGSLSGFFKKTFTQGLTFFMSIFAAVIGAQSLLAGRADNLAGRAAKFAVGSLIPTVGSALSGTLGTVSGSIEYIRASVGVVGIVAIILMVAPTLVTLILSKFAFELLEAAADILGCPNEKKIIKELSGINGFLLAVAAICSICLVFLVALFAKCSAATGGGI